MLFTAIAGTAVILPFAVQGTPFGDDGRPLAEQTRLVQQPLTGIGGGETIREIHQDAPFSLVALTAADLSGTSARVRAKKSDGSWGPWYEAEALDGVGDGSSAAARHRTGIRRSHHHRADRSDPAGRHHRVGACAAGGTDADRSDLGYLPATSTSRSGRTSTRC